MFFLGNPKMESKRSSGVVIKNTILIGSLIIVIFAIIICCYNDSSILKNLGLLNSAISIPPGLNIRKNTSLLTPTQQSRINPKVHLSFPHSIPIPKSQYPVMDPFSSEPEDFINSLFDAGTPVIITNSLQ